MSLRKVRIRVRLRLALWHAVEDAALRNSSVDRQTVYVGLAADYGNLGDLAITYAQLKFLKRVYPNSAIQALPISRSLQAIKALRSTISTEDVITLIGGGNTGDRYDDIQFLRERYIDAFPHNQIISFPQSIDFSDTPYGRWAAKRASRVYNSHSDITVMARDSQSYRRAKALFPNCRIILSPDVVLTLDEVAPESAREGALVALRSDSERALGGEERNFLLEAASGLGGVKQIDTHIGDVRITPSAANEQLKEYWAHCRASRVVVTDRLHGMIFSVITGTPCLVFDSGTGKVSQFYRDWLEDNPSVSFFGDLSWDHLPEELTRLSHISSAGGSMVLANRFALAFSDAASNRGAR